MRSIFHLLQYATLAFLLVNCAFGGEEPEGLPGGGNQGNINGNLAEDDLAEDDFGDDDFGDENDNFGNDNFGNGENINNAPLENDQFAGQGFDNTGEGVNSDFTGDEFIQQQVNNQGFNQGLNQAGGNDIFGQQNAANFGGNAPLDFQQNQGQFFNQGQQFQNQGMQQFQNQGMQQDFFDDGAAMNNALEQENNDFFGNNQQTDIEQAAMDTGMNESMEAAPAGAMDGSGGRVKYITSASNLYDQPDGSTVSPLEKGDHPLVFDNGEWHRTSDGYYVPSRDLTTSPVGREKRKSIWLN